MTKPRTLAINEVFPKGTTVGEFARFLLNLPDQKAVVKVSSDEEGNSILPILTVDYVVPSEYREQILKYCEQYGLDDEGSKSSLLEEAPTRTQITIYPGGLE